ncbi:MAG: ketoacyl-ACP synthase III [Candidatus Marinimicrobia bacterium]|jgi:3-oxoacyl-[acyl-carrier-protein] synthase-3|nr:ketoacyl-ACP synthase III [Candidatus Neomarinimicrobiota bacterium]MBT3633508.1 ketoacyl-ACP synthase III [Candidatus Neomarinimicrobiota bacterium]MBT3681650.1 ketoacyl-ACP synthase III [Candidatus Neomarinimicrobiota bacterium]MBT3758382.1 ketoacyl-ACP synthase III [Candidatus Neomarinimicrobiota bacterium]MBT3894964.1 ketoacyl-ACP synthase III [Candidatus Neomarinimicrobiota bacterium]
MNQKKIYANITALGMYVPENILTNADLEKMVETTDEWIVSRTGIKERRIVAKGETTSDLCTKAVEKVLEMRNISADEIDAIIVATITPDMMLPSTAAIVQDNIGAVNAWGYDLSAACSGFLFGLQTGAMMIETGRYKKVLIIGAETMSSIIDYTDRNTCIIFGDGAGAVLLEPSDEFGIIDAKMRMDGSGGKFLNLKGGGSLHPASHKTVDEKMHYVYQDGRSVFKFAVKGMADISFDIAKRNGLANEDIDLFIPHQANKRIIDASAKRLGISDDKVLINIDKYANTTAATIPIGLVDAFESGRLNKGDNVILSAFGAGFTWGAMYIKWGISNNA